MIPTVSTAGWCLLVVAAIAVGIAKTALPGAATLAVALFAAVLPARASTGALSGFTTMTANAGGPVMTMYLLASRFAVAPFLGTTAWFFFAVNVVKLPLSIGLGVIRVKTLRLNAVLAPVVIVSALAGRRLAIRMNQNLFDRLVTALTVVSAGYLIVGAM